MFADEVAISSTASKRPGSLRAHIDNVLITQKLLDMIYLSSQEGGKSSCNPAGKGRSYHDEEKADDLIAAIAGGWRCYRRRRAHRRAGGGGSNPSSGAATVINGFNFGDISQKSELSV